MVSASLGNSSEVFDPTVSIRDHANAVVAFSDDIRFDPQNPTIFGTGPLVSRDSMILNYRIPVDSDPVQNESQEIFIQVTGSDTFFPGDYNLFVTVSNPFHNPQLPGDVNGDGSVTALDANLIIGRLGLDPDGDGNNRYVPTQQLVGELDVDVNNNGEISSLDALNVINAINVIGNGGEGEFVHPSVALGVVGYADINSESIQGLKYYEFSAEHDAQLTVDALFTNSAGDIDLTLYKGANSVEVGSSDDFFSNSEQITVSAQAGDTFILEVAGTNANVDLQFTNLPDLVVSDVQLNNGNVQRSSLDKVEVAFNDIIVLDESNGPAFTITNRETNATVDYSIDLQVVDGVSVATLTFLSGTSTFQRQDGIVTLNDGNYELHVNDTAVQNRAGALLDGDNNGIAGGDYIFGDVEADDFFRLYGDGDGDGAVGLLDFSGFRQLFGSVTDEDTYHWEYYGLGVVNLLDFTQFRQRFGTTRSF